VQVRGLDRTDLLKYHQRLPQHSLGLVKVAVSGGAAAQADQCVSLMLGARDSAGQIQSLLVTLLSLREVTPDPVQRPSFVERLGLAFPVTNGTENA
jgi:hypothetical protein